jgi:hypothetical protein
MSESLHQGGRTEVYKELKDLSCVTTTTRKSQGEKHFFKVAAKYFHQPSNSVYVCSNLSRPWGNI